MTQNLIRIRYIRAAAYYNGMMHDARELTCYDPGTIIHKSPGSPSGIKITDGTWTRTTVEEYVPESH